MAAWLNRQKPMARVVLGMVAGRTHGAEGIVGLAPEHRIDSRCRRTHGAQGRFERTGRHHRIRIEIFMALFRRHGLDGLPMLRRMGQQHLLFRAAWRLPAQGLAEMRRAENRVDGLDAVHPFRMAGRRVMGEAGRMAEDKRCHACCCSPAWHGLL